MTDVVALLAGVLCGAMFAVVRLPVPAPPTLAGVLGVVGIAAGYAITARFM